MKIGSIKIRNLQLPHPSVFSGTAYTLGVVANDKITRTLSGNGITNDSYMYFRLPDNFKGFPVGALEVITKKNNASATFTATIGKNGVADANVNSLSMVASALNVYETKLADITGSYVAGDWLLIRFSANSGSGGGATLEFNGFSINYYG